MTRFKFFAVLCIIMFSVGVILLLFGNGLLNKYKKKTDAEMAHMENDKIVSGNRTTGLFIRNIIMILFIGIVAGFMTGAIVSFLQNR